MEASGLLHHGQQGLLKWGLSYNRTVLKMFFQIGLEVLSESKGSMSKTCVEGCTVGVYAESGASMDISNGSRSQPSNYAMIYDVNAPQDLQL